MTDYHQQFMAKTIESAKKNPSAPYGAIIVYDNKDILCKSVNNAQIHPLMHGELSVIHRLFENGFDGDNSKLSLYSTAEPCPMCAAAIYWAMIPTVVYGASIPLLHNLFGRQIQIRAKDVLQKTPDFYNCTLIGGVLEDECTGLFFNAKKLRDSHSCIS